MSNRQYKSRLGAGIAALVFLLIFGGIGALAFWAIGASIHDGMRAKEWVRVKANVERVDTGTVTYSYEWEGKRRFGDRAGTFVLGGNSDVDDFDDRMEALLEEATEKKKPITVWVNPQDPSDMAIFPLIGALIVWGAACSTAAVLRDGSPFNARSAA